MPMNANNQVLEISVQFDGAPTKISVLRGQEQKAYNTIKSALKMGFIDQAKADEIVQQIKTWSES